MELEIGINKLKDLKLLAQVLTDYQVILEMWIHHINILMREKVKINSLVTKKQIYHNQEFQK